MIVLRGTLPAHGEEPRDETAAEKAELKALAAEFPGSLRELDTLPEEELHARAQALESAAAGGEPAPWMAWMIAYHRLMRTALAIRRGETSDDEDFTAAVKSPRHGRIMAEVFARLEAEFHVPAKLIWDTLFPPRKGDRPYRS